ncbi:MAG: hypothetical protein ACJ78Q_12275, partial [Chloroflexia bacterium]
LFKETGKRVGGPFLAYWKSHGGLAQQGYPISEEFQERSDLDGKTYLVQYFERAVFEYHPEKTPPYDVLLSQLGTFRYGSKYAGAESCDTSGNINGRSEPTILKLGSTVRVYAWGFTPPEKLTVQVTKPDGTRISSADFGLAFTAQYSEFDVPFTPAATDPVGRYSVSIEGFSTHHRSVIYICVVR